MYKNNLSVGFLSTIIIGSISTILEWYICSLYNGYISINNIVFKNNLSVGLLEVPGLNDRPIVCHNVSVCCFSVSRCAMIVYYVMRYVLNVHWQVLSSQVTSVWTSLGMLCARVR